MERRQTILVIKKYYDPGNSFTDNLEKSGYHTMSLSNHSEILDVLVQTPVDMIIIGITTTVEFCESLMRQLRKRNISVPIIAVSAFPDIRGKQALMDLGLKDWISRPFDMEYVRQRVAELLCP